MRRLGAYYATLLGAVILTNVAIYFVATRLLGLPPTPSFRFLAMCTLLMVLVAAPVATRRIRAERVSSSQERVSSPSGADPTQARLATGIFGFVACVVLVAVALYLISSGEPVLGGVSAIVAAVVGAITSRRFRRAIRRQRRKQDAQDGTASP